LVQRYTLQEKIIGNNRQWGGNLVFHDWGITIDNFNAAMCIVIQHQPAVMIVEEVTVYLRIPRSSIYKLAQEGRIPSRKVGRYWLFRKEAIDQWWDNSDKQRHN